MPLLFPSDFPRATKKLLCNKPYLFMSLSMILYQSITVGLMVFIPKYVQVVYTVLPATAGIITGMSTIFTFATTWDLKLIMLTLT